MGQIHQLRARDRAAHQRGRNPPSCIVVQLHGLAQHGTGLGHRSRPEVCEYLGTQPLEAGLFPEGLEGRQGKLFQILGRPRGEGTSGRDRPTVHPDHPANQFGMPIEDDADRGVGSAVRDEDHRLAVRIRGVGDDPLERCHLIVEGPGGSFEVCLLEAGKGDREGAEAPGGEVFHDCVPCPGTQPVSRDQDDGRVGRVVLVGRVGGHAAILAGLVDNGVSPFLTGSAREVGT